MTPRGPYSAPFQSPLRQLLTMFSASPPVTTAAPNTTAIIMKRDRFAIGSSHSAGTRPWMPNTLPYSSPNTAEATPASISRMP